MSETNEQTEKKQGFFLVATFDRIFQKERKHEDGTVSVSHYVGVIVRNNAGTKLFSIKTEEPQKYANFKVNQYITIEIGVGVFKGNMYFKDLS